MLDVRLSNSFQSYMAGYFPEISLGEFITGVNNAIYEKLKARGESFEDYEESYISDRYYDYVHGIKVYMKRYGSIDGISRIVDVPSIVKSIGESVKILSDI